MSSNRPHRLGATRTPNVDRDESAPRPGQFGSQIGNLVFFAYPRIRGYTREAAIRLDPIDGSHGAIPTSAMSRVRFVQLRFVQLL